MANRVSAGLGKADVLGTFKGLQIAEFSARNTPLAGLTVRERWLREPMGLNVVGVWHRGRLMSAFPQTPITSESILEVVGSPAQLTALDSVLETTPHSEAAVLVIVAGTVAKRRHPCAQTRGRPRPCARARPTSTGASDERRGFSLRRRSQRP